MEGARWDVLQGVILESHLKELFPLLPVINVRVRILSHRSRIVIKNNIIYIYRVRVAITGDHAR